MVHYAQQEGNEMTRTEELLKLAEAANENATKDDWGSRAKFELQYSRLIAACTPETIKQLVELCRLMKTPLLYLHKLRSEEDATYTGSALEADVKKAIATFNKFEGGE